MIETLSDRFAGHVAERGIAHPGGGYCPCGRDSVVWWPEGGQLTRLCKFCFPKYGESLDRNAESLEAEAEQERLLAAELRAAYRRACRMGIGNA